MVDLDIENLEVFTDDCYTFAILKVGTDKSLFDLRSIIAEHKSDK